MCGSGGRTYGKSLSLLLNLVVNLILIWEQGEGEDLKKIRLSTIC